MNAPVGGLGRHHIEMTVDQQRTAAGVGPGQPGEHVAAAGRTGLQILRLEACLPELAGHPLGALRLPVGGLQLAGIGGVEPDKGTDEPDHLVFGSRHGCIPTIDPRHEQCVRSDTTSLPQTTFTTRAPWGSIYR